MAFQVIKLWAKWWNSWRFRFCWHTNGRCTETWPYRGMNTPSVFKLLWFYFSLFFFFVHALVFLTRSFFRFYIFALYFSSNSCMSFVRWRKNFWLSINLHLVSTLLVVNHSLSRITIVLLKLSNPNVLIYIIRYKYELEEIMCTI